MSFRRAAKKDLNHMQIVEELRSLGFRVDDVAQTKKLYDLVVTGLFQRFEPRTVRVEVKSKNGRMTDDELEYHRSDPFPETLIVARSTEEILSWFQWDTTKPNSLKGAATAANAAAEKKDTTRITRSSTTSKRKAGQSTRNSTTPAT